MDPESINTGARSKRLADALNCAFQRVAEQFATTDMPLLKFTRLGDCHPVSGDADLRLVEADQDAIAVIQRLRGAIAGHVVFLLDEPACVKLVRGLFRDPANLSGLTDIEEDVLLQIGNQLINCWIICLAHSDAPARYHTELPFVSRDPFTLLPELIDLRATDNLSCYLELELELDAMRSRAMLIWCQAVP